MRFLETHDSIISYYPIMFYLFSAICFASSVETELLSQPGCPRKCGNLTIPFPFGMSSECSFDHSFHITCNSSMDPPKPFLRLLNAEVVSISLDGKVELLNSSSSLVGLEEREGEILHMVVNWAAGDEACHAAQRHGSRYACRSPHSQCMDSSTGQGHVCRCLPGYQGNPYLAHGCRDIDECAVSNPCEGVCENLPGGFKCHCAKGLVGDGGKDSKGCRQTQDWSGSLVVLLPIGIFIMAPVLAITIGDSIRNHNAKLDETEGKYFKINGGPLLLRKLNKKNLELERYSTKTMDSISTFWPEIKMIRCNPRVKFYRGTLTRKAGTNINDVGPGTSTGTSRDTEVEVVVQKIEGGVLKDKLEDFMDELIFLSEPRADLVRVLGCCLVEQDPMIVYERRADENTTLFDCTSSCSSSVHAANFSCGMRIEAAKGVARGLEHFYKFKSNPTFLCGEISSANIMMDTTSYEPKIFHAAGSNLFSPTLAANDPNEKSDVYNFGTVLVELLTGGRTVGTDLSNSIETAQANGLFEILDDEMKGNEIVVRKIATVADKCLNVIPEQRPTMKEVLDELLDRPTERPGRLSRMFHRFNCFVG